MKTLFTKTWSSLRFILIIIAGWLIHTEALAQNEVAIGSANTKSNAILWLNGNGSQGLILPTVTNKSAVASPDEGMIVYDNSDNKLWYRNNSTWVEVGGGSGGGGTFHLEVSGNLLRLLSAPGGTLFASTNIAGGTQTNGSFLVFESGAWRFTTLSGDITGANGNLQLKGKAMANLPASTQVLAYDPTANSGNGGWVFQTVAGGGSVTNVTGTAPVTVTNPTTTPIISLAAAGITNALLANDAVTTAKILDGTITGADIANTTITANKLAQSGATNNQILQWNGTNWVPVTLAGGGSVTNVATGTGLTGGPITTTGTISIAAGGVGNTELANDAVTSAKIADATITGADIANTTITSNKLAQSTATPGQVLKWNGTNWLPSADDVGGGATPTLNPGQILIGDGTSNAAAALSGDATLAGGVLTITNNAITTAKIADATITGADIANTTITANKLAQSAATPGQVLKWNGTNWLPSADDVGGGATPTLNPGQILIGDGTSNAAAALSGDATLTGGVLTIANNAITTAKIANNAVDATKLADNAVTSVKIADATITGADIANTTITANKLAQSGATNNQILQWNGSNWLPVTLAAGGSVTNVATGAGLTGGPITTTGTIAIAPGGVDNTMLADNAVTSIKIADATITGADIANTTITANKLAQSAATPGQVLKWNGTNWLPSADDVGGGATPTLNPGQILIGDGTSNAAAALSGDATLTGGVLTIANNAITTAKITNNAVDATKLADNAVTTAKIADATITGADIANTTITANKLAQSGALNNQILQWNGTNWVPTTLPLGSTDVTTQTGVLVGDGLAITGTTAGVGARGILGSNNNTIAWVTGTPNQLLGTDAAGDFQFTDKSNFVFSTANSVPRGNGTGLVASAIQDNGTVTAIGGAPVATNRLTVSAGTQDNVIQGTTTRVGAGANTAFRGDASGSTTSNFGVYGNSFGAGSTAVGVYGSAGTATTASGVSGFVGGGGITTAYGVQGTTTATGTTNYGVYGSASGAATNWAGYFAGNTAITGALAVGGTPSFGAAGEVLTSAGPGVAPTWSNAGGSGWSLTGNAGINPATNFIGTTDAQGLSFRTNDTERLLIAPNNNPGSNLFTIPAGAGREFYFPSGGDNIDFFAESQFNLESSTQMVMEAPSGVLLQPGGGNVGIGAVNPNAPLQFASSLANRKIVLFEAANNDHEYFGFGINSAVLRYQTDKNSSHVFYSGVNSTTSTELMRIQSDGNVGVGTATPGHRLDIAGNINVSIGNGFLINNVRFLGGSTTANNIFLGGSSGGAITSGASNVFVGSNSGQANTTGTSNVFIGNNAGFTNVTGISNVFMGAASGDNSTGSGNTFIGHAAGSLNTTGSNNTVLGDGANVGTGNLTNATAIGSGATVGASNRLVLGAIGTAIQFDGELRPANNAGLAGQVLTSAGPGVAPTWSSAGGSGWSLTGNAGINPATNFIGTTDAQPLRFATGVGGIERMRISPTGNVGIGNNNPNALLSLGDLHTTPVGDRSVYMSQDGGDTYFETASGDMSEGLVMHGSGGGESGIVRNIASSGFMSGKPAGLHIFNDLAEPIMFTTNNIERMRIADAGNVGIGTTTPAARLNVQGNTLITGTNTNTPFAPVSGFELSTGRSNSGGLLAGQTNGDLSFQYGAGGFRHFIQTRHFSTVNSTQNAIDFYINNSTTAAGSVTPNNTVPNGNVHGMSITAAGVGIGTSTPIARLHVGGDVYGSGRMFVGQNQSGNVMGGYQKTNPDWSGASYLQISSIPATSFADNSPAVLELRGASAGLNDEIGVIDFVNRSSNTNDYNFARISAHKEDAANDTYSTLRFYTRAGAAMLIRMRITSAGLVGLGRAPTTNLLEVEGNASKTAAGGFLANSDRRIKTDILDIDNSLDLIKKLRPVKFKYTQEWMEKHPSLKDQYYYNFIAQEFREVFPEAVQGSGEYIDGDANEVLQIDTHHAQIVTIKAVQDQQIIIEAQQDEINKLKKELESIKNYLNMEAKYQTKKKTKN